jgi:ABC-type transport system involved in multi-copper enzyme maturation permease subunit
MGKSLVALLALVVFVTAAFVATIAAAAALFMALVPSVGPALSALIVALALVLLLTVFIIVIAMRGRAEPEEDVGLLEHLYQFAKDRPFLAAGAAMAATMLMIRNPTLVATLAAAFINRPRRNSKK